jgi:thioredoxin reductase (NADPH)
MAQHHRLIIIGSGPAGWTAALYAARAGLNPLVICGNQPGGQLTITTDVENYPGFVDGIQGPELMEKMRDQALRFGAVRLEENVAGVNFSAEPKFMVLDNRTELTADAVIIATGAKAKWLDVPGEKEFMGRGVSGCATCDGFFFRGLEVAVVGGGNVAVEEAIHLAHLASKVTLIHRRDTLRCEKILEERLRALPNVEFAWNEETVQLVGDESGLTEVQVKDVHSEALRQIPVAGFFVAIGHEPATWFLNGEVTLLPSGHVKTGPMLVDTSKPGVFAAGDVMDPQWRQAVTSAGFGCMAALAAEKYLAGLRP